LLVVVARGGGAAENKCIVLPAIRCPGVTTRVITSRVAAGCLNTI
jgi:hypothetical protein